MTGEAEPDRLLAIYLNDHHAGATAGVELVRRLHSSNQDEVVFAAPLREICSEIEADRETLEKVMERLGVSRDPVKPALAWAGEKLGRLKLNGQLTGYSPLSRLLELELLNAGITGKLRLWKALEQALGESLEEFDFGQLAKRAEGQRRRVEKLHLEAAAAALNPAASVTAGGSDPAQPD